MDCIKDLQDAIRNILVNNGLTELCLGEPDELDDPTYIIWYDRHCEPHEDPVLKVYLENEGIAVEVEARSFGNTITVYDYDIDRIEWWKGIHANILEVLERDGKRRCPACGRTVKGRQGYCGAGCRDFMTPGPTVEQVAEKANRNIRKLASLAAGKDKAYRKRLIEKYTVGPS